MGAPNHDPGAEKGPGGNVSKNPWPTGMVTAYAWSLEKELYQASLSETATTKQPRSKYKYQLR